MAQRKFIKILVWGFVALAGGTCLLSLAFDLINASSTVLNICGVGVLFIMAYLCVKIFNKLTDTHTESKFKKDENKNSIKGLIGRRGPDRDDILR